MATENISPDLIWNVIRKSNVYTVRSKVGGGKTLSRDPLNLSGLPIRQHNSLIGGKAVGLQSGEDGSLVLTTKTEHSNKPSQLFKTETLAAGASKEERNKFLTGPAKSGYRTELQTALARRAAALQKNQKRSRKSTKTEA